MQQTNHWFVACDRGAELCLGAWNPRSRLRARAKHLCGHTCLHKLVDDFMARTLSARTAYPADESAAQEKKPVSGALGNDGGLTSIQAHPNIARPEALAFDELESSARLITPLQATPSAGPSRPQPLRLAVAAHKPAEEEVDADGHAVSGYSPRNWQAEAWKREREREKRAAERTASSSATSSARRHSIA